MLRYIATRLLWAIPVLLLATLLTFVMVRAMGDPFATSARAAADPVYLEAQRERYGLNDPVIEQYLAIVKGVPTLDFGASYNNPNKDVREIILELFPTSAALGLSAFLLAMFVGTTLGAFSASRHNTKTDHAITVLSTLTFAIPTFTIAALWVRFLNDWKGWDTLQEKSGPIIVLSLAILPYFVRLVRGATIEALSSDYVTAARAKGIGERRVVVKHVLRNSLIPMVTNSGPMLGFLITGAFVVEFIMNVPGLGREFVDAALQKDLNMVMGTTVLLTTIIVVMNLIVDIILGFIDPRIVHD